MARRVGSAFRGRRQSLRRQTSWGPGPRGSVSQSVAGKILFPIATVPTTEGLTVVRTRGELLLYLSGSDGATSGISLAFGMAIVSDEALGAGVGAVPGPFTDPNFEGWFVYWTGSLFGSAATGAAGANVVRLPIDSKAMRKFFAGTSMVAVLESSAEAGVVVWEGKLETRQLVKLP